MNCIRFFCTICLLGIEAKNSYASTGQDPALNDRKITIKFRDLSKQDVKEVVRKNVTNGSLNLANSDVSDDQLLEMIVYLSPQRLTDLNLSHTLVTTKSFFIMSTLNQLGRLTLRAVRIFINELSFFKDLKSLSSLDLSECPDLRGDITQAIRSNLGHLPLKVLKLNCLTKDCPINLDNLFPNVAKNIFTNLKQLSFSNSTVNLNRFHGFPLYGIEARNLKFMRRNLLLSYAKSEDVINFYEELPENWANPDVPLKNISPMMLDKIINLRKEGICIPMITTDPREYSVSKHVRKFGPSDYIRRFRLTHPMDANYIDSETHFDIKVFNDYPESVKEKIPDHVWLSQLTHGSIFTIDKMIEQTSSGSSSSLSSLVSWLSGSKVSETPEQTGLCITLLNQSDTLMYLDISENKLEDHHLACLSQLTSLRTLCLDNNPLRNGCLEHIKLLPLKTLSLRNTFVVDSINETGKPARQIKPSFPQSLQELMLDGSCITGEMVKDMTKNVHLSPNLNFLYQLKTLTLFNAPLTETGLLAIFQSMNHLKIHLDKKHKKRYDELKAQYSLPERSRTIIMFK